MRYFIQKLAHFFFANWLRKITALILAIIIYATIYGMQQSTATIQDVVVTVEAENGLILDPATNRNPVKVSIVVSGDPNVLERLSSGDCRGQITVRESDLLSEGVYKVKLSPDDFIINTDAKISVVKVRDKSFLFVNAQRRIRQYFDVEIKTDGALSEDFQLGNVTWEPRKILLEGAENVIRNLKLTTPVIHLSPTDVKSYDIDIEVRQDDHSPAAVAEVLADGEIKKFDQANVKAHVEILAADPVAAVIPGITIETKRDPLNKYVVKNDAKTAELIVIGVPSQVKALTADPRNIVVSADIASVADKPGTHSVPLSVSLPKDGVKVQKITPERIEVTVSEAKGLFH